MSETPQTPKRKLSPDWFVQGILAKIGDAFDRLLGRGWKPSSSLATSELIERLKALLDSEAKETATKAKFVPHNIVLKMQWDKFSTDSEAALRTLENELLTATVDHINDRRYYTYAPLNIEVKPDYFTSGVKLYAGFEKFHDDDREAEVNVTMPGMRLSDAVPDGPTEPLSKKVVATFTTTHSPTAQQLEMIEGKRLSVGRTKENAVTIADPSVSKIHASLMLNSSGKIVVADTGSTNGTFVNGDRIAYGKGVELAPGDRIAFGSVDVAFEILPEPETAMSEASLAPATESYKVGEFEFSKKLPTKESTPGGVGEDLQISQNGMEDRAKAESEVSPTTAIRKETEERK